ncbi:putative phage tail protein [Brevibacillus brevis]|uniref:putative phage tail protein n=1 Tax=Brevibacillus brevis TaxID=1393 RepID=UPI0013DF89BE|nr:putative phage tail protein [Brevibacillus brevis]
MLKRLQPFQRKSKVYKAIFDTEAEQLDSRDAAIADLHRQMSVDSATWALSIYETELGIPVDASKPIDERRSLIKSKMRGTGKVDAALIKLVVDSWTNGQVEVAFANSTITITFSSIVGIPPNIEDVKVAIEDIKPAHLAVLYVYLFNRYEQLLGYTHNQLATRTHEELRSSTLP